MTNRTLDDLIAERDALRARVAELNLAISDTRKAERLNSINRLITHNLLQEIRDRYDDNQAVS